MTVAAHKEGAIRWLLTNRANDLRELMEGESAYTLPSSLGISKASRDEGRAWTVALYHVRFATKFGLAQSQVWEGTHLHSAFPEEFETWLSMGAPGISDEELTSYLHANP